MGRLRKILGRDSDAQCFEMYISFYVGALVVKPSRK